MYPDQLKKVRLFAFDLDGTLLNSQKKLTKCTLNTLSEISTKGFKIVFASGRIKSSMLRYIEQCSFPVGILSLNGAAVYSDYQHNFKNLFNAPLPSEYADFLIKFSENQHIAMNYYFDENLYTLKNEKTLAWIELYINQTHSTYHYLDTFEKFLGKSPSKIIFVGSPELLDKQQRFFSDLWGDSIYICRTWKYYLEFLSPHTNKGIGLASLADHYNIPMNEVVAFGDASNDIPMLERAGYSIAVQNASPEVKTAAKKVSPWTNDEDAIMHEWQLMKQIFS